MKISKNCIIVFLYFIISWALVGKQPTTIFCHGILDTHRQLNRYQDFIQEPSMSFDFIDAQIPKSWNLNSFIFNSCSLFGKTVNREKMYMGYGEDIKMLKEQINPDQTYILFGFSRGGTAIINYLADNDTDNIKAVILNATPADTIASVDTIQKSIGYTFAPTRTGQEYIFNSLFPAYPIGSMASQEVVAHIKHKNLPILIVHAQTDSLVPIDSAWQLYSAFKHAGFTDVYLCQLESGQHKNYPQSPDKLKFLQSVHSFYKKYHFDYNPEFAVLDNLSDLQPDVQTIIEKLNVYQQAQQAAYHQKKLFNSNLFFISSLALLTAGINMLNSYDTHSKNDAHSSPS